MHPLGNSTSFLYHNGYDNISLGWKLSPFTSSLEKCKSRSRVYREESWMLKIRLTDIYMDDSILDNLLFTHTRSRAHTRISPRPQHTHKQTPTCSTIWSQRPLSCGILAQMTPEKTPTGSEEVMTAPVKSSSASLSEKDDDWISHLLIDGWMHEQMNGWIYGWLD